MFEAMDEDGDGTVDFHEFTIAMTGSAKSTVDSASEYDVDRLTKRFIEFANIRRRELALDAISTVLTGSDNAAEPESEASASSAAASNEGDEEDSQAKGEQLSFDAAKIHHFRTCFAVFNSRVTEDTMESEIESYYAAKGIKGKPKNDTQRRGTIGATAGKSMNATTSTVGVATTGLSVPDFRAENTKTQGVLDLFLTDVSNFANTEESPAFRAKAKEQHAEDLAKQIAEKEKLLGTGAPLSPKKAEKEEPDEDMPIGIVVENLTPSEEREKREREFVDIQKRRAEERARLAEEAMVNLDQVEEKERLREERVYVLNIKKKPWVPKPATGGIPKWAGPDKKPTLIPLSTDQVLRKEMQMRVKTRRDIAALKAKRIAEEKAMHAHALGAHLDGLALGQEDYKDMTFQSNASIGDESSTIYIDKAKPRKIPPPHGIMIRFADKH